MTTTYATRTRKANAYAGTCAKCSGHVPAQTGYLGSRVSGRWTVEHTECPATDPAPAEAPKRAAPRAPRYSDCDNGHTYYQASCFCCRHQIGL